MPKSPLRSILLWSLMLPAISSCSADRSPMEGAGGGDARAPVAQKESQAAMPAALRMAFLRTRQKGPGYDFVAGPTGALRSHVGSWGATADVEATARGVRLSGGSDGALSVGVETRSVGREDDRRSQGARVVLGQRAEGQELVLDRENAVEERFLAGPLGLEHSFLVGERPAGSGELVVEVAFTGLVPEAADDAADRVLLTDAAGRVRGGYKDLVVADAAGRELEGRMEVRGGAVALLIDDAGARYPLRVDPIVWTQQAELTASDGAANDVFSAVAVDGKTAVIGASGHQVGANAYQGAAYVFVQNGTTWTQQAELTSSDGAADDGFGVHVAVSGTTVVVSASNHEVGANQYQGAAYVFVQNGTTWTQQAELVASDGATNDQFGVALAVSGNTAIVGAFQHQVGGHGNQGAAYVFARNGTTWAQQAELTASDGAANNYFGASVALDGTTAIVGAYGHKVGANTNQGAAYVFAQNGTTWTQQAELTAGDGAMTDQFGFSVAVSGPTAVVGAYAHQVGANALQGAAYVFVQNGTTWTQQAELTASDGAAYDCFGFNVAVSGTTAVIGGYQHKVGANANQGAAYVFVQNGAAWTQQAELIAGDGAASNYFGTRVAVSGPTTLVGAPGHAVGGNSSQGAAYVFVSSGQNGASCAAATDCLSGFCTDGVCCNSACGNGVANDCQACSVAAGAPANGTCSPLTGAMCDDGNPSTVGDVCKSGVCAGVDHCVGVTCVAQDQCHSAGTCVDHATGACSSPALADGTMCDDHDPDTVSDVCTGGLCGGVDHCIGVTCADPDQCHSPGSCDHSTGVCSNPAKDDATPCDDGDPDTVTDVCTAGICAGTDLCANVICPAPDQCHDAGACDHQTGVCSNPAKVDGAACDDGNACTQNDACQGGVCSAASTKTCPAADDCHDDGACDPGTGDCSNPSKSDGSPCAGGSCQAGICQSDGSGGSGATSGTGVGGAGGEGGGASTVGSGTGTGGKTTSSTGTGGSASASGSCAYSASGTSPDSTGGLGSLALLGALVGVGAAGGRRRQKPSKG